MDIRPFRVGTIVGVESLERIFKIKRMGIYEEQLNEILYPEQYEFKIELLLVNHKGLTFPSWKLPSLLQIFDVIRIGATVCSVFQMQYNIDNSIEVQLRTYKKL